MVSPKTLVFHRDKQTGFQQSFHMKINPDFYLKWVLVSLILTVSTLDAMDKKIILVAGKPSHGPGDHEFNAGCLLLENCLDKLEGIDAEVHPNGWPADESILEKADAVFLYMDGGGGHPAIKPARLKLLEGLMEQGIGLGCAHYAVEVPVGRPGKAWQKWIGGHYENQFSCNPFWSPEFDTFPDHPITNGVKPFRIRDEWYFNMRFRPERKGVIPILSAKPSDDVRNGPYVWPKGPYPHIQEAKGRSELMMWAVERSDGGRGFGFTGGHVHRNWGNVNYRKTVLNALLWIAKVEVPRDGVKSTISEDFLKLNLDSK